MQRFWNYTRLAPDSAEPAPNATVTVYVSGTLTLATIYADDNPSPTPKANPFTSDASGYFYFYAPAGRYDVRLSGGGIAAPFTWGDAFNNGSGLIPSYAYANLPASSSATAGALARVTDTTRGLWMDTGTQWYSATGAVANVMNFGAKGDGITDDTAAINAALAVGTAVYFPPGYTFMTTGGHTINAQTAFGVSRETTVVKRLSGSEPIFTVEDDGQLKGLTVDGNSLDGELVVITRATAGSVFPITVQDLVLSNAGAGAAAQALSNVTAPNDNTLVFTCANHGYVAGDYVMVRNVNGFFSTAYATQSLTTQVWKIDSATQNTFTVVDNTLLATQWTPYVSGGTVERASYALSINLDGGYAPYNITASNIEYRDNYGHMYVRGDDILLDRMLCYGDTQGYAYFLGYTDGVHFLDCYFASGGRTVPYSVRDITFTCPKVYLNASTPNWFFGIGMNYGNGQQAGEVANITIRDGDLRRVTADTTNPLFVLCANQFTCDGLHLVDFVSGAGWSVFQHYDMAHFVLRNVTVESVNAWLLFHVSSQSGTQFVCDGLYYTQGVIGSAVWPNTNLPGHATSQCLISNSNINHAIKSPVASRGFIFINIDGDVNLTNLGAGGSVLINVTGTVTDPNGACTLFVYGDGPGLRISPGYTYADNAAALAAGRVVGDVYKTPTGALMTVY